MTSKQLIALIHCIEMCTRLIMAAILTAKEPPRGVAVLDLAEKQFKEFNREGKWS